MLSQSFLEQDIKQKKKMEKCCCISNYRPGSLALLSRWLFRFYSISIPDSRLTPSFVNAYNKPYQLVIILCAEKTALPRGCTTLSQTALVCGLFIYLVMYYIFFCLHAIITD
jgi:hypothetical protein